MRVVLDASAAVNALLPTPQQQATLDRLTGTTLYAPSLIDTEVLSAVARLERGAAIDEAQADAALIQWSRLPCERISATYSLADIWQLRHALRISDAHYVALAQQLDAPLMTADARLARAGVPGVSILLVR